MKKGNTQSPPPAADAAASAARCQRLTLSLPADVASAVDALAARKGAASRSALVADLLRAATTDAAAVAPRALAAGAIVLFYDHHARGLQERLTAIQHNAGDLVLSVLHIHLDHHHCLEILAVRGRTDAIRRTADLLESVRGVLRAQLCLTAIQPTAKEHPHAH
ncbi:MAG: nickel-responsive transcriptional regulator NikR [Kiritimatiellae bacterium]|nr:nickel-responsive transcriptional regulator NikR [Kiritimatiellia bacterium]